MPSSISDASGVKVSYSYLSDGTKLSALKPNGEGLVYRGPFVYRRGSGGALTFESVSVDEGRLSSAGEMLYVEDYLGSVRAVVSGSGGTLLEASNYSAFGARAQAPSAPIGTTPAGITLRDHYTAQEDQTPDFAVPYTDFGARQYNVGLRRWMTSDPLSEKYYGISPYAFCNNSPMVFVDPDGRVIDTAIDVVSITLGVKSLVSNIKTGNVWAAVGDGAGIAIDAIAAAIPFVPGGVGAIRAGAKAFNILDNAADGAKLLKVTDGAADISKIQAELGVFQKAAEFGVDSYKNLRKKVIARYGKGSGLEVHHLIEQRFAKQMGMKADDMPSIVLTHDEHMMFTSAWRDAIGYNKTLDKITTNDAMREDIIKAAEKIYNDYPEILIKIKEFFK